MGFRFKIAPGVRVRVSSGGMGVGVGPRVARVHVSNRGIGVSSGAGPFSGYQHLGGGTRAYSGGEGAAYDQIPVADYERQLRAAARSSEIVEVERVDQHLKGLQEAHLQGFTEVTRPVVEPAAQGGTDFSTQEEADAAWDALMRNDVSAVLSSIMRAFEDNEVVTRPVGCEGDTVMLAMILGEPGDLVQERCADVTAGGRATVRKRTKTEINEEYLYLLASNVLSSVKEAFAAAPAINTCRIVVMSHGRAHDEHLLSPLYCGSFTRAGLASVDWEAIDAYEMIDAADEALMAFSGRTDELVPVDLTDHEDVADMLTTLAAQLNLTLDPESAPEIDEEDESNGKR